MFVMYELYEGVIGCMCRGIVSGMLLHRTYQIWHVKEKDYAHNTSNPHGLMITLTAIPADFGTLNLGLMGKG